MDMVQRNYQNIVATNSQVRQHLENELHEVETAFAQDMPDNEHVCRTIVIA